VARFESINVIYPDVEETPEKVWSQAPECPMVIRTAPREPIAGEWAEEIPELIGAFREELTVRLRESARIGILEREPYEVIKPFQAVVRVQGEDYIATFFDANLSASGETQAEAIYNLKDVIVGVFDILDIKDESELGPGPAQQKKTLQEFIRKKE